MKKNQKFKEYYKKFKELWATPRYKAIIKLSLYAVMFLIIIIMANLYQETNMNIDDKVEKNLSYSQIIKTTDLENGNLKYVLKTPNQTYNFDSTIKDNIINGYLENNNIIKKINIHDNAIYQIIDNNEVLDDELNSNLDIYLLYPKNIIELIQNEQAIIEKETEKTIYNFKITYIDIMYTVKMITNANNLTNIIINSDLIEYNMECKFDIKD